MVFQPKRMSFSPTRRRINSTNLGILAFEAARTMSRLVSLHRSLAAPKITRLRSSIMRSTGIAYLVSTDQLFLLRLACAELLDDLNRAASVVSRIAGRSSLAGDYPRTFHHVYTDLKSGTGDLNLAFNGKNMEKAMKKMEMYVSNASKLQTEMESLTEVERFNYTNKNKSCAAGVEVVNKRVATKKQLVRKLQTGEGSLWCEPRSRVSSLMARVVIGVFARVCAVFAPVALELPLVVLGRDGRYRFSKNQRKRYQFSAPLLGRNAGNPRSSSGPLLGLKPKEWSSEILEAPSRTVGGSGLALRYAEVIAMLGRMLETGEGARETLYGMLPGRMRSKVSTKLRGMGRMAMEKGEESAWREAAGGLMEWLGPVAEDTMRWHEQRSFEGSRDLSPEGRVLVLQTLVFADREKVEAAVVELLVALSCAWRCKDSESGRGG